MDGKSGYRSAFIVQRQRMSRKELLDFLWTPASRVAFKSIRLQRPARARDDQPVVNCAYGYQKENQEEADEVEENCGQEGGADEEAG